MNNNKKNDGNSTIALFYLSDDLGAAREEIDAMYKNYNQVAQIISAMTQLKRDVRINNTYLPLLNQFREIKKNVDRIETAWSKTNNDIPQIAQANKVQSARLSVQKLRHEVAIINQRISKPNGLYEQMHRLMQSAMPKAPISRSKSPGQSVAERLEIILRDLRKKDANTSNNSQKPPDSRRSPRR